MTGSSFKSSGGLTRIARALVYSLQGLRAAWRDEAAFRQELLLALVLVPIALWLPATLTQKALLLACVALVLITELLNSAVESAIDRISNDPHSLSKKAKDIGSAAVFVSLVNLAVVWGLVLVDVY